MLCHIVERAEYGRAVGPVICRLGPCGLRCIMPKTNKNNSPLPIVSFWNLLRMNEYYSHILASNNQLGVLSYDLSPFFFIDRRRFGPY